MSPAQFWAMDPAEFHWLSEAWEVKRAAQSGRLTEEEVLEMKDELRQARVAAGYPPE